MEILQLFHDLLNDYTLRTVALGSGILGIVSGALGSFAMLRKQSLLGDAISHAALPGIALAFLLTLSKSTLVLVFGAAISGWLATIIVLHIIRNTRVKDDSALGLVLSVFFGFGLLLLTFIQKQPYANQAGLDHFLFGQAAALLQQDVMNMGILSLVVLLLLAIFWKEFKLVSFDPDFGHSLGLPVGILDVLLTSLLVMAIVVGLQTVGVVLMSAMVVAPAAAARQWTDRLGWMVFLSSLFGALAGIVGAMISSSVAKLPTGPTIVLSMSAIVLTSILFAGNRGLIWQWVKQKRNHRKIRLEAVLEDLLILSRQHENASHGHPIEVLRSMSLGHGGVDKTLKLLEARGWVKKRQAITYSLTPSGLAAAEQFESAEGSENA